MHSENVAVAAASPRNVMKSITPKKGWSHEMWNFLLKIVAIAFVAALGFSCAARANSGTARISVVKGG